MIKNIPNEEKETSSSDKMTYTHFSLFYPDKYNYKP